MWEESPQLVALWEAANDIVDTYLLVQKPNSFQYESYRSFRIINHQKKQAREALLAQFPALNLFHNSWFTIQILSAIIEMKNGVIRKRVRRQALNSSAPCQVKNVNMGRDMSI